MNEHVVVREVAGADHVDILSNIDPARAMGLIVSYLMTKPAFARQPFGYWARIIAGQINRGHYRIAVKSGRVRGFLGWALTSQDQAEIWLAGGQAPKDADCRDGEALLINAWAADGGDINRSLLDAMRQSGQAQKKVYFKRYYADGRIRPGRLDVNSQVAAHLLKRA